MVVLNSKMAEPEQRNIFMSNSFSTEQEVSQLELKMFHMKGMQRSLFTVKKKTNILCMTMLWKLGTKPFQILL